MGSLLWALLEADVFHGLWNFVTLYLIRPCSSFEGRLRLVGRAKWSCGNDMNE